ncbi:hypothetical protein ES703_49372 [subsurface metagenome]
MNTAKLLVSKLDSISEWTGKVFSWVIVPLTLLVVFEVITRRGLHAPTIWSFEVIKQLYGLHFMIVAAYGLLYKAHVSVDFLYMRWAPKTQAIVDMVCYAIFFFAFVGIVLWKGIIFAQASWTFRETSFTIFHPPLYPIKTVVAVAAALLIIQGLSDFIKRLIFVTKGAKL